MAVSDKVSLGIPAAVLDRLEREAEALARRSVGGILAEVPQYATLAGPTLVAQLEEHSATHTLALVAWARAGCRPEALELGFVRERARMRARGVVPIDALLRSYLVGQRETWLWLMDALGPEAPAEVVGAMTMVTFEYTQAITAEVAAAYLDAERELAAESVSACRDLVEALLDGRPLDSAQAARAAALGLGAEHGAELAVARLAPGMPPPLSPSAAPQAAAAETALRRLADLLESACAPCLVAPRHDEVVLLAPARPGLRAAAEGAHARAASDRLAFRAGFAHPLHEPGEVARAHAEALRALRHTSAERPLVALGEVRLVDDLSVAAGPEVQRLIAPKVRQLLEEDARAGGALAATLDAYAAAGMNVARAGARLFVHPNTVRYRLRRIAAQSGLDPARFDDLEELLTATRVLRGQVLHSSTAGAQMRESKA